MANIGRVQFGKTTLKVTVSWSVDALYVCAKSVKTGLFTETG